MAVGIEHSYVFFQAVALLTECVDRNRADNYNTYTSARSHSLRSAWIEIGKLIPVFVDEVVALLTECVDRNC